MARIGYGMVRRNLKASPRAAIEAPAAAAA